MTTGAPRTSSSRSRLLSLVIVVAVIGAPAAILRGLCIGHSCDEEASATSEVPFCSLPADVRDVYAAGFEGELHRSPDVLGITGPVGVAGGSAYEAADPQPAWPSLEPQSRRVPIVFSGTGVDPSAAIPAGTTLDDVAPTLAEIIDFRRPNPQVRSGEAIEGVANGDQARLVVEVALKNVGSDEVEDGAGAWPNLQALLESGAGTVDGDVGSLPIEPTAALTTIGTGGLPHQHGMIGALVRDDDGRVVRAWGPRSPVHIIATLPDDLDENLGQEPKIGLVRSDVGDTGLVGGNWYIENDRDDVVTERSDPAGEVRRLIRSGYGDDDVPDVIAVALEGDAGAVDEDLGAIAAAADSASATLVVVGSGSSEPATEDVVDAAHVVRRIEDSVAGQDPAVDAAVPGGIYLDQETLVSGEITEDDVLKAFSELEGSGVRPLMVDAFTAIAVSFARYC